MVNGIYAAVAWLILDFGFLLEEHGGETISVIAARPEMAAGGIIVIVCILGLFYKSRLAASVLFLLFLVPLLLRIVQGIFPPPIFLIFSLVLFWSIRLTLNWVIRWRGLKDEDWRYIAFRFKYQEQYWVVSLFGIHLFPTLIVFFGCLSVYPGLLFHEGTMGVMEWIAIAVTASGVLIETIG